MQSLNPTTKRTVHLYGALAEQFGDRFELAVRSPVEAVRLLEANFPGKFCAAIKDGSYHVVVGDPDNDNRIECNEDMLRFRFSKGSIHFIPVLSGRGGGGGHGKGLIQIVLGVSLIALAFAGAFFFAPAAAALGGGLSGGVAASSIGAATGGGIMAGLSAPAIFGISYGQIGLLGFALTLAGVATLLTPTPKSDSKKKQSYMFSGPVNITAEGVPVPLVYGHVLAGSVTVFGAITVEKLQ